VTDQQLIEHLSTLNKRLDRWLASLEPANRIDALAEVHDGVATLMQLVKRVRRETLTELVREHGVGHVSHALSVSQERLQQIVNDSPTY
jgi:hypothetical protein